MAPVPPVRPLEPGGELTDVGLGVAPHDVLPIERPVLETLIDRQYDELARTSDATVVHETSEVR